MSISRWFQTIGFAAPFQLIVLGYLLGHFYGFMPMVYKLYEVKIYDGRIRYIISGLRPRDAAIAKALKTDKYTLTEIPEPIIL